MTDPPQLDPLHRSRLLWNRVILERRYWTSISVAVMAAFAWALVVAHGSGPQTALWWALATVTASSFIYWLVTFRALSNIQRRLERPSVSNWELPV